MMTEDEFNEIFFTVWSLMDRGIDRQDIQAAVYNAFDTWTPEEES